MYGLNHKTLLETCVEVMSIKRLNCVQAVDKFYEEFYGFSILKPLGLHRTRKLKEYAKANGGFENAMGKTLLSLNFQSESYIEGSIACHNDTCFIYIGNDYYAQSSVPAGCVIKKINPKEVSVWSCQI